MDKPQIVAYLKTHCGWSAGVRAVLAKYGLPYEEKDIIKNPAFRWEMEQKSGQPLSPCIEINGEMLADISGEEVEAYLLANGLVGGTERQARWGGSPPHSGASGSRKGRPIDGAASAGSAW